MMRFRSLAFTGVVVVVGLGAGAAGASAYSISGGAYAATATSSHFANIGGGGYTVDCPPPTFSGVATGAATTSFTPSASNCNYLGLPADYTFSGPWELTVISGPVAGWYSARVDIPTGSTVKVEVALAGCTVLNSGPQAFVHGVGGNVILLRNVPGGVQAEASVGNIAYTATGCPFLDGSDGSYNTNGLVDFPGITIS